MFRPLTPTQRAVDLLIAGGYLLIFILWPLIIGSWTIAQAATSLVLAVALGLRRASPPLALGIAWAGVVVQLLGGETANLLDAAIPPIVYACAADGSRSTRWAAFSSSLVGAGIAGAYTARGQFLDAIRSTGDFPGALSTFATVGLLTAVTLLLAWTLGLLVATAQRSRRNREEADQAGRQVAAEQERTRIARDMHDVVAHSLAVVIAQSDGARLLRQTDPAAVDEALGTIGATARAALADVRVLLQQLRYEGTTSVQPGLGELETLIGQFRGSGLDVTVARDPDLGGLGTATELAAFRIVQESLTNALRHGDLEQPASVAITRTPHGLEVEVVNAIDATRAPRPTAVGHGLIGMRERAGAVQGELRAGPDGDRFRVRAFLPSAATAAVPVQVAVPG